MSFLINPPSHSDQKSYSPIIRYQAVSAKSRMFILIFHHFPNLVKYEAAHQNFLFWSWPLQIKLDDESVWNIWSEINIDIISSPLSGFYLSPLSLNAFFNSPLNFWWDCPGRTGEWGSSKASKIPHIFSIVFYSNCSPPRLPTTKSL